MPFIPFLILAGTFVSGAMFAGRAHAEALKTDKHREDVHAKLDALHAKIASLEASHAKLASKVA